MPARNEWHWVGRRPEKYSIPPIPRALQLRRPGGQPRAENPVLDVVGPSPGPRCRCEPRPGGGTGAARSSCACACHRCPPDLCEACWGVIASEVEILIGGYAEEESCRSSTRPRWPPSVPGARPRTAWHRAGRG